MLSNQSFCSRNIFWVDLILGEYINTLKLVLAKETIGRSSRERPLRGHSQTTFTRGGGVGGPKMSTFCQRSQGRKCQRRGVCGQKRPKSCQRSL